MRDTVCHAESESSSPNEQGPGLFDGQHAGTGVLRSATNSPGGRDRARKTQPMGAGTDGQTRKFFVLCSFSGSEAPVDRSGDFVGRVSRHSPFLFRALRCAVDRCLLRCRILVVETRE